MHIRRPSPVQMGIRDLTINPLESSLGTNLLIQKKKPIRHFQSNFLTTKKFHQEFHNLHATFRRRRPFTLKLISDHLTGDRISTRTFPSKNIRKIVAYLREDKKKEVF